LSIVALHTRNEKTWHRWLTPVILAAQEDHSSKPVYENLSQKRAGGVAQGEGPEFKPQYQKKKRRRRRNEKNFFRKRK
jgi:hypothetical protein